MQVCGEKMREAAGEVGFLALDWGRGGGGLGVFVPRTRGGLEFLGPSLVWMDVLGPD